MTYSNDAYTKLLTSVTDSQYGTTSWTFDSLDRITSESGPAGTLTFTLNDKINRREGLLVPGQAAITYAFDNNDNLISTTQNGQTTSFMVDAFNRIARTTRPNGVVTEKRFDTSIGGLASLVSKQNGTVFDNHAYTRDWEGNITQEVVNGATNSYGYDDLYRLTSSTVGGVSSSWTYDQVGNRLSQTVGGVGTSYTYNNANRLLTVNGASVTSDANGSVTASGTDTYQRECATG